MFNTVLIKGNINCAFIKNVVRYHTAYGLYCIIAHKLDQRLSNS